MWVPFRKPPYRWLRRTALDNISYMWYELSHGPGNVWRWLPIIWFDRDYDHSFLLDILEYKFKRMADSQQENQIVTSWPRKARELRVCQLLCRRLNDDNYMDNAVLAFGGPRGTHRATVVEAVSVQKNDQEYLGRIIGKHLITWWD